MTENSQKARETTPEENFRELYKRFAQLNDKVSALLAPAWDSEMGLIPSDHPLYQGEKPVQEQEQGAPVDWRAVVERRERELKTVGEARHAAEQRAARAEADLKTLGQTALGYQQRALDAEAALARVRDALNSAYRTMVHDSRDWAATKRDAWLYAILVGWTCEDDHAHDDLCMGDDPLTETARQHGWDDATVARLRSYRTAVAALGVDGSGQPVSTAETPIILPADHTTEN